MDIKINYESSDLNGFELKEIIDKNILKDIIKYEDLKNDEYDESKRLNNILKKISKNNILKVEYKKKGKKGNQNCIGRVFASRSISYQGIRKEVRHTLAHKYYTDIDIQNCHPNIIVQMCKYNDFKCDRLEYYINNRNKILKNMIDNLDIDRDTGKELFLRLLYGGSIDKWCQDNDIDNLEEFEYKEYLNDFENELKKITKYFIDCNQDIIKKIPNNDKHQNNKYKTFNKDSRAFCYLIQELEHRILENVFYYLKENGYIKNDIATLCFDGIMISKIEDKEELNNLLVNINKYIKDKLNFNLIFEEKKMDKILSLDYDNKNRNDVIENYEYLNDFLDSDVAQGFCDWCKDFMIVNNKLYNYNGILWKYIGDGIYKLRTYINTDFYNHLKEVINNSKVNNKHDLFENIKKLKRTGIMNNVISNVKDRIIYENIELDNNPLIIVFLNGVYDFKNMIFRKTEREEYITNELNVGYNYEEQNKEDIKYLKENLINKIYVNEEERYIALKYLSTGLLGIKSKLFMIYNGDGNNGKSVLYDGLFPQTIGNYFYKGCESILFCDIKEGANVGIANMNKKRYTLWEEPNRDKMINSNIVKQLSGNPRVNARALYSNNNETILHSTLGLCANTKPFISSGENAIRNRIIDMPHDSYFGEDIEDDNYEEKEFKINKYFATDKFFNKYKLSFFHILKQYAIDYINNPVIDLTERLLKRRDEYLQESDPVLDWFFNRYQITNDENDIIYFNNNINDDFLGEITSIYEEAKEYFPTEFKKRKLTKSKLLSELKKNWKLKPLYKDRKCINYKDYRNIFIGVKKIEIEN
jgi:phage/plasmid-associated DNA primase